MTQFRSSSDPDTVYETQFVAETDEWICTCPSFAHRDACPHIEQLLRWQAWGMKVPDGILDAPPPMGSWTREEIP